MTAEATEIRRHDIFLYDYVACLVRDKLLDKAFEVGREIWKRLSKRSRRRMKVIKKEVLCMLEGKERENGSV